MINIIFLFTHRPLPGDIIALVLHSQIINIATHGRGSTRQWPVLCRSLPGGSLSNCPVAYEPLSDNIYSKTNYFRVPFNRMHVAVTVFVFPNVYELICKDVNCDGDI